MVMLAAGSMASRISGFGSPGLCSEMSFPSLWRECIQYCSYGVRREVLPSGLRRVIVLSMGLYSCLRVCCGGCVVHMLIVGQYSIT